jgi:hypothetical protein
MFKSFGMFFNTVNEVLCALNIVARTGTAYAEQFETDAQTQLAKKRALLLEQEELTPIIEATS